LGDLGLGLSLGDAGLGDGARGGRDVGDCGHVGFTGILLGSDRAITPSAERVN
jgi:hypothetical protein